LKILQISTFDIGGGAENIALNLFKSYNELDHISWLAVGYKRGDDQNILEIPRNYISSPFSQALFQLRDWLHVQNRLIPGMWWRLSEVVDWIAQPETKWDRHWGIEDFHYHGSRQVFNLLPELPDVIHAHNLHGKYFDLRYLPKLSKQVPLVITIHDEWMLTGHCAYSIGCFRWEKGCGSCPNLDSYPSIKRDATKYNWRRKREIYKNSKIYVVSPSKWLLDRVQRSMLNPIKGTVIHNGVNLGIFNPSEDQHVVRKKLRLPNDAIVLLTLSKTGQFKDYQTIEKSVLLLKDNSMLKDSTIVLVALGGHIDSERQIGQITIRSISYISNPIKVSQYYRSADIFLHAAHSDNFPTTILESFASGTPVIATAVGGIPEQIREGETGFLVPYKDSIAMARAIIKLIQNPNLRRKMGQQAAEDACKRFDSERMVNDYMEFYQETMESQCKTNQKGE